MSVEKLSEFGWDLCISPFYTWTTNSTAAVIALKGIDHGD